MKLLFSRWFYVCQDKAGDPPSGGGGNGGGGAGNNPPAAAPDVASLQAQLAEANAKLKALESKPAPSGGAGGGDPEDLADKVRKQREAEEKAKGDQNKLEAALRFELRAKDWLKDNASLLPKSIEGIFTQAAKEVYGSAIEKDGAIKSSIISEFFSIQANVDLLSSGQKAALEDFQKLTKNVKQDRAKEIYDMVFEPAFESLKREKKAAELRKGHATPSDADQAYKEKMIGVSKKKYLGEK